MNNWKLKFGNAVKPESQTLQDLIESIPPNGLSNFGALNQQLAEQLRIYLQLEPNREIVLCSSGHTALMAAYAVSQCRHLIIPTFTFESTYCAATLQGIQVILAEPNLITGCFESADLINHINKADGVVSVCALSTIPNLKDLSILCKQNSKKLIIDGAATFGTPGIYNYGDYFCLSFHGTKTFPIGEAGAVICSSENAIKIRQYINFGFNEERIPVIRGMNAKLPEYLCAIGLAIFDKVLEEIELKLEVSHSLKEIVQSNTLQSSTDNVYSFFPIIMPTIEKAYTLRKKLTDLSIENKAYYRPLSRNGNAVELYNRSVCIPCHSGTIQYLDEIIKSYKESS